MHKSPLQEYSALTNADDLQKLSIDDFFFESSWIQDHLPPGDYKVLTEGKYLRTRLISMVGRLFELRPETASLLGKIVELVHNATLVHDDVIDQSETRRGRSTVPSLVGNRRSVVLGDYILAKSMCELAKFENPRLITELSLTLKDLVEGEWIQMDLTNPFTIPRETYERMVICKTGSIFRWCFIAPAILSNIDKQLIEMLQNLGEKLGILFQIVDDVLDFSESSGKTPGLDLSNKNMNFVFQLIGEEIGQNRENSNDLQPHPSLQKYVDTLMTATSYLELSARDKEIFASFLERARQYAEKLSDECLQEITQISLHISQDELSRDQISRDHLSQKAGTSPNDKLQQESAFSKTIDELKLSIKALATRLK